MFYMQDIDNAFLIELKNTFKLKFKLVYDPAYLLAHQQSPLAFYRMFKTHIYILVAHDINHAKMPQLLGYGDTDIVNIIKRMKRDHFEGDIWLDPNFERILQKSKIPFIESIMPKLFKEKTKLKERLQIDIKKDITARDVYENQIDVLQVIFKLW
jgi:hypothetical protein